MEGTNGSKSNDVGKTFLIRAAFGLLPPNVRVHDVDRWIAISKHSDVFHSFAYTDLDAIIAPSNGGFARRRKIQTLSVSPRIHLPLNAGDRKKRLTRSSHYTTSFVPTRYSLRVSFESRPFSFSQARACRPRQPHCIVRTKAQPLSS